MFYLFPVKLCFMRKKDHFLCKRNSRKLLCLGDKKKKKSAKPQSAVVGGHPEVQGGSVSRPVWALRQRHQERRVLLSSPAQAAASCLRAGRGGESALSLPSLTQHVSVTHSIQKPAGPRSLLWMATARERQQHLSLRSTACPHALSFPRLTHTRSGRWDKGCLTHCTEEEAVS